MFEAENSPFVIDKCSQKKKKKRQKQSKAGQYKEIKTDT